jgi:hypothetical protein
MIFFLKIKKLIPVFLIIFFFCSKEEHTPSFYFDKKYYEKKCEAAFFSDSAIKELRLLRNEIYARHGRKFNSSDLNRYFSQYKWYKPSDLYNDSCLSKNEIAFIEKIKSYENTLINLSGKTKIYYDSLKEFYNSKNPIDTSIIEYIDFTGDLIKEKCITKIKKENEEIIINHLIIDNNDTIYNKSSIATFNSDINMPFAKTFTNFKKALLLSSFVNSQKFISSDIKKYYNGKPEYEKYLSKFNGKILFTVTGETAPCSYFWYKPQKKFLVLYCQ